jgi:hypothetical protein
MPYPAVPYNICPCCGTEFGVDDLYHSLPELRQAWISEGLPWFDDITSQPSNWNPYQQLLDAGFGLPFLKVVATGIQNREQDVFLQSTAPLQRLSLTIHRGVGYAETTVICPV